MNDIATLEMMRKLRAQMHDLRHLAQFASDEYDHVLSQELYKIASQVGSLMMSLHDARQTSRANIVEMRVRAV